MNTIRHWFDICFGKHRLRWCPKITESCFLIFYIVSGDPNKFFSVWNFFFRWNGQQQYQLLSIDQPILQKSFSLHLLTSLFFLLLRSGHEPTSVWVINVQAFQIFCQHLITEKDWLFCNRSIDRWINGSMDRWINGMDWFFLFSTSVIK